MDADNCSFVIYLSQLFPNFVGQIKVNCSSFTDQSHSRLLPDSLTSRNPASNVTLLMCQTALKMGLIDWLNKV